jgi:hypothetical protein
MKGEYSKIIEMVKKGAPDKEIMRALGVQTKTSLKRMYYDALVEAGKIRDILSEKEVKKAVTQGRTLKISKRGTILLSRKLLVDNFGFREGDRFAVSKRKDSVILRKEQGEAGMSGRLPVTWCKACGTVCLQMPKREL